MFCPSQRRFMNIHVKHLLGVFTVAGIQGNFRGFRILFEILVYKEYARKFEKSMYFNSRRTVRTPIRLLETAVFVHYRSTCVLLCFSKFAHGATCVAYQTKT